MPKVKATEASKMQSVLLEFPLGFMKSPNNELYCNLCSCTVSCKKRFLVESYQNRSTHQKALGSRSDLSIPYTLQTFLRCSNIDFVEKITKAFSSADIPLYKLNNKHIKNLFHHIGHCLSSETTCRKTVLQLRADELQWIRDAVHDKQIFQITVECTFSSI